MAGVRLMIQFTAESAELAEEQVQAMVERCRKAQKEPGCLQFEVFRSALRTEQYALLEHWASEDALEQHRLGLAAGNAPPSPSRITRVREQYEYQTA